MRRLIPLAAVLLAVATAVLFNRSHSSASAPANHPTSQFANTLTAPTGYVPGSYTTAIATDTWTIQTYPYAPALFWMTNTQYNISYPVLHWDNYYYLSNYDPTPTPHDYQILALENEWLKVWLMPELGGRVYQILYKPTNRGLLYRNWTLKPTNWGPQEQGWWLPAGGIEWGFPVEEHGYEWGIPWSYEIVTGTHGITVTLRDSVAPDRLRAAVSVFLPNDRAVLVIHPRIENNRDVGLNFKWWINAMLAPGGMGDVGSWEYNSSQNVRFVYPTDQVTIHSTGDASLPGPQSPSGPDYAMSWPIYDGRDLSYLRNWNQYLGFFARPAASSDFAGVYNTNTYELDNKDGIVRIFPHHIATGLKGFGMGWNDPLPWDIWDDTAHYYVEMHGGLAPTFWDSAFLPAHSSIEWDETWFPVSGLEGLSTANEEAALHIEQSPSGQRLNLGVYSTRPRDELTSLAIYQRSNCHLVTTSFFSSIRPETPITRTLPIDVPHDDISALYADTDRTLATYNVTNDGLAPVVSIEPVSPVMTQTTFPMTFTGSDADCIRFYDAQVREGLDGEWTPWITGTFQTTFMFTGEPGKTYFFRLRARDLAGNVSAYAGEGDTFTTILLRPSAVMETSRKVAPRLFRAGEGVTYTTTLSNTGDLSGDIALTDTLPLSMTLIDGTLWASYGPTPIFDNGRITWSGAVTQNESVWITYALTPTLDLDFGQPQTNTVVINGGVAPVTRSAVTSLARSMYLPLIMK